MQFLRGALVQSPFAACWMAESTTNTLSTRLELPDHAIVDKLLHNCKPRRLCRIYDEFTNDFLTWSVRDLPFRVKH